MKGARGTHGLLYRGHEAERLQNNPFNEYVGDYPSFVSCLTTQTAQIFLAKI